MQVIRILIELDNESIVKTFQDRQIEINKKLDEFQDVQLVDEENAEEIKNETTENFVKSLDKSREVTQLMISANQEYNEGKFDLAEPLLPKAIALDPNYAIAYENLGVLLYAKLNRPEESIGYLEKSISLDNTNPASYLILSSVFRSLQNKKALDKNTKLAKNLIKDDDYYALACLNSILDNKEDAFRYLKLAIEKDFSLKEAAKSSVSLKWIRDDERFREIVGGDDEKGE